MSSALMTPDDRHQEKAVIIHPELPQNKKGKAAKRSLSAILEETEGLAAAIALKVLATEVVNVAKIQAGYFLGKGQREKIAVLVRELEPDIVIFNHALSPVQQRNLERQWQVKVIDRTGLILEIFGARAQTKEGRLQVDLAALEYQRSRLVRSWTHLERQRGGAGFMGGPGETQIEIDRRMIGERITKLKKELKDVRRTRELGRKNRESVPFPVISLVGYTNAGKSTLFNKLTSASVFAEDLPFATLDPTMRRLELPNGQQAILSDTVGFIADLPTHLIEAFRATLEQIMHADLVVHVIDVSRPDYEAQVQDVIGVLQEMGLNYKEDERIMEVWNKADLLSADERAEFSRLEKHSGHVLVSAQTGKGMGRLLERFSDLLTRHHRTRIFRLRPADGKALSWLYDHAEILERINLADAVKIQAVISPADQDKFACYYGYSPEEETGGDIQHA